MGFFDSKSSNKQSAEQTSQNATGQAMNVKGGAALGAKIFQPGANYTTALVVVAGIAAGAYLLKTKKG